MSKRIAVLLLVLLVLLACSCANQEQIASAVAAKLGPTVEAAAGSAAKAEEAANSARDSADGAVGFAQRALDVAQAISETLQLALLPQPMPTPTPDPCSQPISQLTAQQAADCLQRLAGQPVVSAGAVVSPTVGASTAVTPTWPVGWPKTAQEFLDWVTAEQPKSDGTWLPVEIAEVSHPVGEPFAWRIAREKNLEGEIVPFWVKNPMKVLQDGWMANPADREKLGRKSPSTAVGSGIPPNWSGLAEGATFRP